MRIKTSTCPHCGKDRAGMCGTGIHKATNKLIIFMGCPDCNESWGVTKPLSRKYINTYTKLALKALSVRIDITDCAKLDCNECPFICLKETTYNHNERTSWRKKDTAKMKKRIIDWLVTVHGEQKAKELLTEELI
jgi:transcription elongation factor Elf1